MRSSGQAFKSGLDKAFASLGVAGNDLGILTSASKLKSSISEEDIDADIKFIRPNFDHEFDEAKSCLLYTSPSPRDGLLSRMPSSA